MKRAAKFTLHGSIATILIACATGGGESGTGFDQMVHGTITRFGSIFVNGVEYDTSNATFMVDGQSATESQLAQGMVVTFTAKRNADGVTGVAGAIRFADAMEGIVTANTLSTGGILQVMNHTITLSPNLVFDDGGTLLTPSSLNASFSNGSVVEISGYPSSDGSIIATRIKVVKENFSVGDKLEVKGKISNLSANTFDVGGLTVYFDNSTQTDFTLATGSYVEIEGEANPPFNGSNQFIATKISKKTSDTDELRSSGKETEIEGIVTNDAPGSGYTFELNGQPVLITSDTNDAPSSIVLNMELQVKGFFDSNGVLVADEIETQEEGGIKIVGFIDVNGVLAASNAVNVMGQTFYFNNQSIMKDSSSTSLQRLSLANLNAGDRVEIRAFHNAQYVATYLERDDINTDDIEIVGAVTAVETGTNKPLTVEGIVLDISSSNNTGFTTVVGNIIQIKADYNAYTNGVLHVREISN